MKITELRKLVALARKSVWTGNTRPILSNVLIGDNKIISTDVEKYMVQEIDAPFTPILVNAKMFAGALRGKKGSITLSAKDKFSMDFDGIIMELPIYEAAEAYARDTFPNEPNDKFIESAEIDLEALQKILFCAAKSDTKYALNGVLFDVNSAVHLVATDTHRLAYINNGTAKNPGEYTVPNTSIKALPKGGLVLVSTATAMVKVQGDTWTFYSRLIEGQFPKYRNVIPNNPLKCTIDREALINALESLKDTTISHKVTFKDNSLVTENSSLSFVSEYQGGFNLRNLLEMLKHFENDTITLQYSKEPGLVLVQEGSLNHIIMPIVG